MKLLIDCFSNLIEIIHFEEIDGIIQKENEKKGLIPNENSIKIYHNIFKALQKLNEFENNFYNISSLLSLNVTINPGNLEASADAELSITELKDKGIKIHLFTNYMLRPTGAHSIQTVVLDSPFVSIRGQLLILLSVSLYTTKREKKIC